jgi:AcrR family transcriptional regulator
MTVDRKAIEREARKELILKGALTVFKEKGLAGAKIDEIARASGFGKATLYYYFSSKEEIFNALLLQGWLMLWGDLEEVAVGGDNPRRTFIAILKRIAELVNGNRPLYEFLFFAPRANRPEENEKADWKVYQTRLYNVLLELIEEGSKAGQFPQMESRLVLKALGGLFHGLVFWGEDRTSISEDEIEKMLDMILQGN